MTQYICVKHAAALIDIQKSSQRQQKDNRTLQSPQQRSIPKTYNTAAPKMRTACLPTLYAWTCFAERLNANGLCFVCLDLLYRMT